MDDETFGIFDEKTRENGLEFRTFLYERVALIHQHSLRNFHVCFIHVVDVLG